MPENFPNIQNYVVDLLSGINEGFGVDLGADVRNGFGKHKRTIIGIVFFVVVGGAEIDAGASLQGGEENGCDVGAEPVSEAIEFIAGDGGGGVLHFGIAIALALAFSL
ncbi:hypothetical protein G2W53_017370 [Senna tora]|uniref:Uncharacterized protein n=1 Tax=Senna tora TaxID=362788 RepID=A0A834WNX0_9FABA|nr:hypothetical protein G2W53_017370 [Senna tora]